MRHRWPTSASLRTVALAVGVLASACGGKPDTPADTAPTVIDSTPPSATGSSTGTTTTPPTDTGVHTGSTTPPATAACSPDPTHPLRLVCTATLPAPSAAELVLTSPDAPTRRFTSPDAVDHAILAWGLRPDTEYTWTLADLTGEVRTGPLPPEFDAVTLTTTGSLAGIDAVLLPLWCDTLRMFAIVDANGQVVWYGTAEVFASRLNGYTWSQADLSVVELDAERVREHHVSGDTRLTLDQGVQFEHDVHHDAARWGEYTYLLYDQPHGPTSVDGVYVFRGETLVGDRFLADLFDVSDAGSEWSHANGVSVTDDGELLLSLRNQSAIVALDGDPESPTFLDLRWVASGSEPVVPTDYRPASDDGRFLAQHNATRVGDTLWLFDNVGDPTSSRAVQYTMDHAAGLLRLDHAYPVGAVCPVQGGAEPIPGGVLTTCSDEGDVQAFDDGADAPRWSLRGTCLGEPGLRSVNRALPVQLP